MNKQLKTFLLFTFILLVSESLLLLLDLKFNLHAPIFRGHIRPLGLLTTAVVITTIILALNRLKNFKDKFTIFSFTLFGTLLVLTSEILFQVIRQHTFPDLVMSERISMFFHAILFMTSVGLIISFLTAFQLKTKKTKTLALLIIGLIIFFNILVRLFPTIV